MNRSPHSSPASAKDALPPGSGGGAAKRVACAAAHWRRAVLIWGGLAALAATAALICPFIGATSIDPWLALGLRAAEDGLPSMDRYIFLTLRLPRMLFGLTAGAGLALAGAVFQALLRNDLATPYTLGVSGGASVGALLVLWLAPAAAAFWLLPVSAFVFATATVAAIYMLARLRGATTPPETLLLAGVTFNLLFGSMILFIQYKSSPHQTVTMVRWLMGGLDVNSMPTVLFVGAVSLVGGAALLAQARSLNLLSQGEATAAHLGVAVERTRIVSLAASAVVVSAIVSLSGPIGFVGLIVPHAMRMLIGPDHRVLLPATALAGGAFLVVCDALARVLLAPAELPVGIVTSFLGAPFFLWLLFRKRR